MPKKQVLLLFFLASSFLSSAQQILIPINAADRSNSELIQLTAIGEFGLVRKARKTVKEHLHTGIDIKRPVPNYADEPIYPIAVGIVRSIRRDGPYAEIIIEHQIKGEIIYALYEHIADIRVNLNNKVEPNQPIARFMNKSELNEYGWQFDHVHLEILRQNPVKIAPTPVLTERHLSSYTLNCFTPEQLNLRFYNPIEFLNNNL